MTLVSGQMGLVDNGCLDLRLEYLKLLSTCDEANFIIS
jgi:hypothetical protein